MVEVNPAGWFQALTTHTAEQLRTYTGSLFASPLAAQSLKTAGGVHPALGTGMAVTANGTPNMTVNVGAGTVFIAGTEGTKQGTYFCQNDAVKNLTITASDPTLSRIDLVVAKVQDAAYSGATNAWSLVVVTGTAAGSPVAPATPANAVILAQIAVGGGVTSISSGLISDKRPYASALGGVQLATSATRPNPTYQGQLIFELDTNNVLKNNGTNWHQLGLHICTSGTRPAGPFNGMEIYETDTGLKYLWTGTAWRLSVPYRANITTVGTVASVSFTGIPSTLREVRVSGTARCDTGANNADIGFRINNDSGTQYRWIHIFEQNTAAPATFGNLNSNIGKAGTVAGATAAAGLFGSFEVTFSGWDSPHVGWLTSRGYSGYLDTTGNVMSSFIGHYAPAGPYNRIDMLPFTGNFVAGSEFIVTGWD